MDIHLPNDIEAKLVQDRSKGLGIEVTIANLDNADLAACTRYWMAHSVAPSSIRADVSNPDATLWHAAIPAALLHIEGTELPEDNSGAPRASSFRIPAATLEQIRRDRQATRKLLETYASMSSQDLMVALQRLTTEATAPAAIEPGRAVYDSTLWHIILPEVARRLAN